MRPIRHIDRNANHVRAGSVKASGDGFRLVAIHPAYQSRGYGRILLQLAEDFARGRGCTWAVLYATSEAVGFYTKAGYVEEDWDDVYIGGIMQMMKPLC